MNQKTDIIYIALGANLSNPRENFQTAISALKDRGVEVQQLSGLWQSPAWPPGSDAPDYLNAVISVTTHKRPKTLLALLQAIEKEQGRVRTVRNAPRTLDLDILDYKRQIIHQADLTIPHPRMLSRGFVLLPLAEIAPQWRDPHSGHSVDHFIARLPYADIEPMQYRGQI